MWRPSAGALTVFSATLCRAARGGVFNISASSSWHSIGAYGLGLPDLGIGGNGDYGLDSIVLTNNLKIQSTSVDSALVAAINDTNYYQGFIGVGVTQGRFGGNVTTNPFIPQLAQTYGTIPSHSYGYTAGAHYRMLLFFFFFFNLNLCWPVSGTVC